MKQLLTIAAVTLFAVPAALARPDATEFEAAAKDIVGAWQLDFTTPDDIHRTPLVIVGRQYQEFVAWYVDNGEPQAFEKVRLDDDALVLTIRPLEHKDVVVTLEARLDGDAACSGTGKYVADDGETGTWKFRGKRLTAADFDESQTWKLSFVTPDDVRHEALVTLVTKDGDSHGWYSGKDHDIPASEVTIKEGKVTMSLTAKAHDGARINMTFRGTAEGDRAKGEAEYELNGDRGTFPFTAQRSP